MNPSIRALIEGTPTPLLLTGSALALLVVVFLVGFLAPALRHWLLLRAIQRNLRGLRGKSPEALKKIFAKDNRLAARGESRPGCEQPVVNISRFDH
jgi:hypothetical protein